MTPCLSVSGRRPIHRLRGPGCLGPGTLAVILGLGGPADAAGTDGVAVRAAEHPGFGRLVLDGAAVAAATPTRDGRRLTIGFEDGVAPLSTAALASLSRYLVAAAPGSDGRSLLLEMRPGVTADVTRLDLGTLVVEFSQGPNAPDAVRLRTGHHEGFTRVVLEWPQAVRFTAAQRGRRVEIRVDRPEPVDAAVLAERLPELIDAARFTPAGEGGRVELELSGGTRARVHSFDGRRLLVDLRDGAAGDTAPTAAGATAIVQKPAGAPAQVRGDRDLEEVAAGQAPAEGAADAPATQDEELDPELRALNRVLVEAGGLLLPAGGVEISPALEYRHRGANGLLITEVDGVRRVVSQDVKRDTFEAALTGRVGLPWNSQAELRVPYVIDQEKVAMAGVESEENDGSGFGDLELALTHQLLFERTYIPDLLAEVRWRAPTGEDSFAADEDELAVGSGFHALAGTLTATKSYDPMVFFGSLSYVAELEGEKQGFDVDPGDTVAFSLGTILAAGPGTSLRLGLSQSFQGETEVDGRTIAGSDEVSGVLQLGAAAALPWRTLLDVAAGVGITDDAPDVTIRVSLPYRF